MELHTKQFTNRYEQCCSSPTPPSQTAYRAPLMVICKKNISKSCCISVIIRHNLVVAVIYLSLAGLLN